MNPLRIVVHDERRFVATALARALGALGGVEVVGVTTGHPGEQGVADADLLVTTAGSTVGVQIPVVRLRDDDGLPDLETLAAAARPSAPPVDVSPSPRELDVARLLAAGLTAEEIAERLAISAQTVASHKRHLYAKLGVRNQSHAVAVLARAGILDEPAQLR